MEITKYNILELLGGDARRYHSAILTSFTFDFSFFEMQAMRALKGAGVRNALVLVDEKYLARLMESPSGMEFRKNAVYGIYPIEAQRVFHPKIILCTGRQEGFLAIGSGNLTTAGHNVNDELWSAFHYKGDESPNAGLFSQVWKYISQLAEKIEGNSLEKINRMAQYSPWIYELPPSDFLDFVPTNEGSISLLPVWELENSLEKIKSLLETESVIEIRVLSPYYEADGLLLSELEKEFHDASIKVVLDTEFGLLPYGIKSERIEFHQWQTANADENDKNISRLHGKLIAFRLASGDELLITGSSNATCAAFGVTGRLSQNKELNVIIKKENSDVFFDIGVILTEKTRINLNDIKKKNIPEVFETGENISHPLKIKYAEIDGADLSIKTDGDFSNPIYLLLFNRNSKLISTMGPISFEGFRKIQLKEIYEQPFYLCLSDDSENIISNKAIIQDTATHLHGNPDSQSEKYESIMEDIERGNFGQVAELLRLVSFNSDEEDLQEKGSIGSALPVSREEDNKEYKIAENEEEFTKISQANLFRQKGLLNSPSLRIAEFLSSIRARQMNLISETSSVSDTGEIDIDNLDGEENDDKQTAVKNIEGKDFLKEKRAVISYLQSYQKHLKRKVIPIWETQNPNKINANNVTITEFSNLLISLHLVRNYVARKFEYTVNEEIKTDWFLKLSGASEPDNQKAILLEIVPMFLLLAQQGIKKYEYESLKNKLQSYRKEAFFSIVFLTANVSWNEKEMNWVKLMICNAAFVTFCDGEIGFDEMIKEMDGWMEKVKNEGIYVSYRFDEDYEDLKEQLIFSAIQVIYKIRGGQKNIVKSASLRPFTYIYNSKLGVCMVKQIKEGINPQMKKLTLARPGLKWSKKESDWVFPQELQFASNVLFEL